MRVHVPAVVSRELLVCACIGPAECSQLVNCGKRAALVSDEAEEDPERTLGVQNSVEASKQELLTILGFVGIRSIQPHDGEAGSHDHNVGV